MVCQNLCRLVNGQNLGSEPFKFLFYKIDIKKIFNYSWLTLANYKVSAMQINMLETKNRLSTLIVAVERDEEVVIARNGVPVAKIVKYIAPKVAAPGIWKGLSQYSTDWDSTETNNEIERLFTGA